MTISSESGSREPSRWWIVGLCFLSQNLAMGIAMGSFGALLAVTEAHFSLGRSTSALGMSVMTLVIGLLAPLAGSLLDKIPVRTAMVAGAGTSAAGYTGLALAPGFSYALIAYGLIGLGILLLAIIGPATLISRWFTKNRAKALGIVNLPVALFVSPFAIGSLLPLLGRSTLLLWIAACFCVLAGFLIFIRERPLVSGPTEDKAAADLAPRPSIMGVGQLLAKPSFWLISLVAGLISGSGSAVIVHMVPFATSAGESLQTASLIMSIYGGAGLVGSVLTGWLVDRIGAAMTMLINMMAQTILWWFLPQAQDGALFFLAGTLGILITSLLTLHTAALADFFGAENISRAVGVSYALKLPFIISFAPLVGWLYEGFGGYATAFRVMSGVMALGLVASILLVLRRSEARSAVSGT